MARQIRIRKSTRRPRGSYLTALVSIVALLALMATPALAHHKVDHDNGPGSSNDRAESAEATSSDHDGDADSSSATAYTEDNDTNDGTANNVADEGDNAHPSGKDRSVESGGAGNQGKSESNPDDSKGPMRYEGALGDDKPNGPGGTDLADQDGNNGCGNDDDFDDDNNGWCGKPKTGEAPVAVVVDEAVVSPTVEEKEDTVLGVVIDRAQPSVLARPATPTAVAAGETAVLPFTGGNVTVFAALGLALIALGALTLKLRTNES